VIEYFIFPLVSFVAMSAQDILCVWMVRAEAQGRSSDAGNWDMAGDACRMAWLYCGGDAIFVSKNYLLAILCVIATLVADKWGTYWGSELAKKMEARHAEEHLEP
jgi:hypothetical protein